MPSSGAIFYDSGGLRVLLLDEMRDFREVLCHVVSLDLDTHLSCDLGKRENAADCDFVARALGIYYERMLTMMVL